MTERTAVTERTEFPHEIRVLDPVWIALCDGTRLCARIWLPTDAEAVPVPAILEYLPYRKDDVTAADDALYHPYFAGHGYAAVRVDIRGSGDSSGILGDEYSQQEQDDALEVLTWIAAQSWCTGKVGMMGISWSGFNSLQVAARRPPELAAIITACSTDDRYDNDVHYIGGVPLGYYLLPWASVMLAFNARPPDPAIVGEAWREMWQERLDGNVDLIQTWLEHQRRDDYWRHGSIAEDYGAITCPVFAVGGWADAYVDAIFRMLEHLSCPRRALVGPWGHMWPQQGRPGPQVGFLQEAVRWWDHHLKGIDTGIMDEPMLRGWMQEPVAPQVDYDERPGRWIAEPAWPRAAAGAEAVKYSLDAAGLVAAPGPATEPLHTDLHRTELHHPEPHLTELHHPELHHTSPQTVGLDAGAWCAYGNPADLPGDQRADDARSLSLDGPPLQERIELLGRPRVRLRLSADRPRAFVVARLCDVAPDGRSTLITRAVLNLCHARGHADPVAIQPGVAFDVELRLKSVAYALERGHRVRLAISTSYWPWLWPSPEVATISVHTGASTLTLPARLPRQLDVTLAPLGPAETAPRLPVEVLEEAAPAHLVTIDGVSGRTELRMSRRFAGARRFPSGLEYHDDDPVTFTIVGEDPLSARVECRRRIEVRRGEGWRTRIEVRATMTADTTDYHVSTVCEAYEADELVHTRTSSSSIPRDHT